MSITCFKNVREYINSLGFKEIVTYEVAIMHSNYKCLTNICTQYFLQNQPFQSSNPTIVQIIHKKCSLNFIFSKYNQQIILTSMYVWWAAVLDLVIMFHTVILVQIFFTLIFQTFILINCFITIHMDHSYKRIIRNMSVGFSSCHMLITMVR